MLVVFFFVYLGLFKSNSDFVYYFFFVILKNNVLLLLDFVLLIFNLIKNKF